MLLNMTAIEFPQQQNSHFSLSCMSATDACYAKYLLFIMCLKMIYKSKNTPNDCRFMRSESATSLPSIYSYWKIRLELCECRIMPGLQKDISRIKCDGSVLLFPKVERWNRYSADRDQDFYGLSQSIPQNGGNT